MKILKDKTYNDAILAAKVSGAKQALSESYKGVKTMIDINVETLQATILETSTRNGTKVVEMQAQVDILCKLRDNIDNL